MLSSAASASAAVRGGIPSWELGGGGGQKGKEGGDARRGEEGKAAGGGGVRRKRRAGRGEREREEREALGFGGIFFSLSFFARFASHSLFLVVSLGWLGFSRRREGRGKEECTVGRVHGVGPMWRWEGGESGGGAHGRPAPVSEAWWRGVEYWSGVWWCECSRSEELS